MGDPATKGFTGITSPNGPNPSAFSSIIDSLNSVAASRSAEESSATAADTHTTQATQTTATHTAATTAAASAETASSTAASSASRTSTSLASEKTGASTASNAILSNTETTFATSTTSPESPTAVSATTSIQSNAEGTAASAASSSSATAVAIPDKCDSISCNSGLKAAIAIPIVVVVLLGLGLIFCLARRRRRRVREADAPVDEKAKPKKKWSRHLRVFSFGEELLMGGRYSSSNSMRTGDADSVASVQQHAPSHHRDPSIHSVDEEVAPPYRDSPSHAERPLAGITLFPRPSSAATMPPPYGFAAAAAGASAGAAGGATGRTSRATDRNSNSQRQPLTPTSNQDPFQDGASALISPMEESPFNHPDDDEADNNPVSAISRQSSVAEPFHDGASMMSNLTPAASETGSIREAQVARGVNMSGARAVTVTRNSVQRLSDSGR